MNEAVYKKMIEKSLLSMGNSYRIKKAMNRADCGQEITLVYLGGSITEAFNSGGSKGYAKQSYEYFRTLFGKDSKVNYVNSGGAAKTSTIGLIRVEEDVLKYQPDIVFVEFAVNDRKDRMDREIFESLLLRLLMSDQSPAVILLFNISEVGYTCQSQMRLIGEYYALPMISPGDALSYGIREGWISWSDYSDDYIHPNTVGHTLISDCINHYFHTVYQCQEMEEDCLPELPLRKNAYDSMKMLHPGNAKVESWGGFQEQEVMQYFRKGWTYGKQKTSEKFKIRIRCKSLFVIYEEDKELDVGNAEVYVDGKQAAVLMSYNSTGWGNPVTKLIVYEENIQDHCIEVGMVAGDSEKKFTLLGFGYCE